MDLRLKSQDRKSPMLSNWNGSAAGKLELIAAKLHSPAVMEAQVVLQISMPKGIQKALVWRLRDVDTVETARHRSAKKLFMPSNANVNPHSGSGANMAVLFLAQTR